MGIAPYKTFTFGGVSSSAYGVYLTGEGVFNAPERAVEMLSIPGRNGSFALDQGRFNNIEITYKAGMYDVTDTNFATKVANLRNWLCSKKGYIRLSDDYNPNEYRMAVYKSGLEVDHEGLINGEFDLVFECKPQRWLTSGESASAVANNGTLSNPTLFESSPLLAVKGYGGIHFNGFDISIQNNALGTIQISAPTSNSTVTLDTTQCNSGDSFYGDQNKIGYAGAQIGAITGYVNIGDSGLGNFVTDTTIRQLGTSFTKSSAVTLNGKVCPKNDPATQYNYTATLTITVSYDGNSTMTVTASVSFTGTGAAYMQTNTVNPSFYGVTFYADSTKSALNEYVYIDCDIGECYVVNGTVITTLNNTVTLGSELPTLASGTNTFTYDNTITELKVTPRWWQV